MKFDSLAFTLLLGVQCLALGGFLAVFGAPPKSVIFAIGGWLIMATGSHWALSSSRARRGQPNSLFASFQDLLHLGKRGWLVTLASAAAGSFFVFAAVLLASPGGA